MALVSRVRANSQGNSGVVEGTALETDRNRSLQNIEIRENDEQLMRAVVGITPALGHRWIEKVCHETVRVTCHGKLLFEHAGSLKLGETFQLIAGKPLQKIQNKMPMGRSCGPKKSADH